MAGRSRLRWRLLGVVFALMVMTVPAAAEGPGALAAGTIELGIAGGVSATFNNPQDDPETVYGYHGLLRLGAVVTNEHGPGILRGNFEIGLQPTYIHLDMQPAADLYGGALVMRWLLAGNGTLRPYMEGGGGILGGRAAGPRTGNCDPNFVLEGGPGVLVFVSERTAIDLGYRFHHISNGGRCSNEGFNSNMGIIGLSYFFR